MLWADWNHAPHAFTGWVAVLKNETYQSLIEIKIQTENWRWTFAWHYDSQLLSAIKITLNLHIELSSTARKSVTLRTLGLFTQHMLAAQLKIGLALHVHTCLAAINIMNNIVHGIIQLCSHWTSDYNICTGWKFCQLSIEGKFVNWAVAISFENPSNPWYYAEWFCMNCKISEQILEATSSCFQNWT